MIEQMKNKQPNNFFLANWYSGATIFSILLNNHKDITCNGETLPFDGQGVDNLFCACSKSIKDCGFYQYSAVDFQTDGNYNLDYFRRTPLVLKNKTIQTIFDSVYYPKMIREMICSFIPGKNHMIAKFIAMHENFFKRASQYNNSKIYIDGTKSIRRVELFAQYSKKPIRIVHCIRDGRRFVGSYLLNMKWSEDKIPVAAYKWSKYISRIRKLKKRYPNIIIKEIRHEDLCRDQEGVLKEVCHFLDVEYDPEIFSFKKKVYHMLGNQMKDSFDGNIRESKRWKSAYTSKTSYDALTEKLRKDLIYYDYI